MSARLRPWLAATLALAATPPALAHGPAPAPLEVLAIDGARATLVRTSIGLALDHPPDAWTYACPSQWGDQELARAAATEGGDLLVMVGGGAVHRSTDGACHFEAVPIDDEAPWYAVNAGVWGDHVWTTATGDGDDGALLAIGATGAATVARRWQGDEAFQCDSVRGWSAGGEAGLLAVGATPTPTLWRGEGASDDPAGLSWSSEPLDALPAGTAHVDLRAVTEGGDVWVVVATPEGRALWRGAPATPGPPRALSWSQSADAAQSLHGPVQVAGTWAVVRDGTLETLSASGAWEPVTEVPWTCLHTIDGVVVACELTRALVVTSVAGASPQTAVAFEMVKLRAPLEGCPADVDGAAACESDWIHFGAEAGLLDPAQLSTPREDAAAPPADDGCGGADPTAPRWPAWAALLALLASSRYRRGWR